MSYPYEILRDNYDVKVYFYNPNISPSSEYFLRLKEIKEYSVKMGFELIEGEFDQKKFYKTISPLRFTGEGGERCKICYKIRLEETAKCASERKIDTFASALSISPHKNAEWLSEIGQAAGEKYGVKFLISDFKKNGGFKRSCELSRENSFYRQNYCGCVYSMYERRKKSSWYAIQKNHLKYS